MIGFAIWSLLMIVGTIGVIIWLITGSKSFMKNKRVMKSLLIVYGAVLVLSVFVFEWLPLEVKDVTYAKTEKQIRKEHIDLIDKIENGQTDEIDPAYIQNTWQFEYNADQLYMHQVEEIFDYTIVIERKSENDGFIEGAFYASNILSGIDITDEMQDLLDVSLNGDTLSISNLSGDTVYDFTVYKKEFVITQFTKDQASNFKIGEAHFEEIKYLYLRVPKDLELIKEEGMFIHYVNK